jgi:hypothetical protein
VSNGGRWGGPMEAIGNRLEAVGVVGSTLIAEGSQASAQDGSPGAIGARRWDLRSRHHGDTVLASCACGLHPAGAPRVRKNRTGIPQPPWLVRIRPGVVKARLLRSPPPLHAQSRPGPPGSQLLTAQS